MRKGQMPMDFQQKRPGPQHQSHPKLHDTNFDMDGKVESQGSSSPRSSDRGPEPMEVQQKRSPPANQVSPRDMVDGRPPPSRQEDALPAVLEFREDKEDSFLRSVILEINSSGTQFKLAPTYTSYMAVRYCISGGYRPDTSPHDRAHRVTGLVNKISNLVHQAVQNNRDNPVALALWLANASEILNFFKQDHDIHPFSLETQEILAESVQLAFHHLVNCLQYDLQRTMPAFLEENDAADDDEMGEDRQRYSGKPTLGDVLDTLSSAMNLLHRCRVNAALTIQLFSQLFHYVNMWLFNVLVTEKRVQFCTRSWGMRLKRRLGRVEAWAEKQGLELAADCHLCRIIQAAHLLEAPKTIADDIANIFSTCFKLNSLQLRELLQQYIPEPNEPPIPQNLIDQVVRVAENMEDEKIKSDGRDVRLEEDPDLQLPFLLPEDGYSCDTIRGIPNGLGEFVEPLARAGVCRMVAQPRSSGEWTVYMHVDDANIEQAIRKNQPSQPNLNQKQHGGSPPDQKPPMSTEPEVAVISFGKVKGSMGLSIVAAKVMASSKPIPCGPCLEGKVNTKAGIWCYNCDEGLCSSCSGHHRRSKGTRDHKIIGIKSYKPSVQVIETQCDKHGQQLNLYCPSHLMPCCDQCISKSHSKCTGIKSLASVVEKTKIEKSKESVEKEINSILQLLGKIVNDKSQNIKRGEQEYENIKEFIVKIRNEIDKHLIYLEKKIYQEADTILNQEKSKATDLIAEIEGKQKKIKKMQDQLHTVIPHISKLQSFLGIHKIEQQVHQCQRYIDDLENDHRAKEFTIKMEENNEVEKIIKTLGSLGELTVVKTDIDLNTETSVRREAQVESQEQSNINNMTMNIENKIKINMESISDMIFLMDGRLIIVEELGKVNLLTPDGKLLKKLPIPGKAHSVTQINQNTIAITYPDDKAIKIFNMENETVTKVITLDTYCYGLSSSDNSLVVGLDKDEIRIIDLKGNTLKSIKVNCESNLYHLVYCNDRVIYSNYGAKAVYCVDQSGKQIWQYTQDLSGPQGLCTDTYGNIFVADQESHRIIVISKDEKESKVLLSDGLKNPRCICLKQNESSGFICDYFGTNLTKFNLSSG